MILVNGKSKVRKINAVNSTGAFGKILQNYKQRFLETWTAPMIDFAFSLTGRGKH